MTAFTSIPEANKIPVAISFLLVRMPPGKCLQGASVTFVNLYLRYDLYAVKNASRDIAIVVGEAL
ncbi:hypothetical protein CO675_29915 [Bradyrhizobium sp. C9]|nr:hypothetical protein CO675_29915 [Bradyrhizobium sp. C9]